MLVLRRGRLAVRVVAAALRRQDQLLATVGARGRVQVVSRPVHSNVIDYDSIVEVRAIVFLILRGSLSLEVGKMSKNVFVPLRSNHSR